MSIVIPVYNVERYISACLDSILNQGLSEAEYEIICIVDKGSRDNGLSIVEHYAAMHTAIKYQEVAHEVGPGQNRNVGLSLARGRYVWYVDGDDRIAPGVLRDLLDICESDNLDMLAFNFERRDDDDNILVNGRNFENTGVSHGFNLIRSRFGFNFVYYLLGFSWLYLYRRTLLLDHSLLFPEGHCSEDAAYACRALLKSGRVRSVDTVAYYYRYNQLSSTLQLTTRRSGREVFDNVFISGNLVEKLGDDFDSFDEDYGAVLRRYARSDYYNKLWIMYIPLPPKEKRVFAELVRANLSLVKEKRKQMSFINRCVAIPRVSATGVVLSFVYPLAKKVKAWINGR